MEAIADVVGWIWHICVGHTGSMNDLNVMNSSLTMQRILSGEFPPRISFTINGRTRYLPYWLGDGIHPAFAIFVKTIKSADDRKLKHFASCQEAVRKDIERTFGILMQRFHILAVPCRMWHKQEAMDLLRACVVLHNMCVEHRRDNYDTPTYSNAVLGGPHAASQFAPEKTIVFQWENRASVPADAAAGTWSAMAASRRVESMDMAEHEALRLDLVDHLWARRGLQQ
jgi:Plant transposon protein